jgi:hypothetical protein
MDIMVDEWLPQTFLEPSAQLHCDGQALASGGTVLDLWAWAMSDLRDNTNRGFLAEFIVGKAIGADLKIRATWADFDILTPNGVSVEVKSSSYLQTWNKVKISKPQFSGLKACAWSPKTGYAKEERYRAMVYVFALQTSKLRSEYDALNLSQWKFWLAPRSALEALNQKSMVLSSVEKHFGAGIGFDKIKARFNDMTRDVV